MHRVLIVEDSADAYQLVNRTLGHSVQLEWVRTVRDAASSLEKKNYDLVLLDAGLPDGDGFQLCSVLQTHERWRNLPVVLLTARNSVSDKVMAFAVGADDYVSKPFDPMELKARVEAKLRKRERHQQASDIVICNELEINKRTHKVSLTNNGIAEELDLTPREFKLLLLLASQPNVVHSREDILNKVWGENVHVYTRSVDTHISKLRKKLGDKADMIASCHGTGYRLVHQPKESAALAMDLGRSNELGRSGQNLRFGHVG